MESDLLRQGLELMVAGMGTVFVFLTLLVAATSLMSRLVLRLLALPADDPTRSRGPAGDQAHEDEEIAAAVAAIHLHRRR